MLEPPAIRPALAAFALLLAAAGTAQAQRVWVRHGPGPNTRGQVENITDREVVGAIHAVAAHPSDATIIYVGAVNGGIWKTTNATAASPTWVEQLGLNRSLSIGAIAFDPTDATNQTLLAGSGRFSNFTARPGGDRVGVWRTTDGGTTWALLDGGGTIAGLNISGVAPRGATLVVSANTATVAASRGIWRSTDGGGVWTQISGGGGTGLPAGASFDLARDPSDNTRLFTNAGTNGIYRSTDTGATWTKVSDAAIDALLVAGTTNVEIAVGTGNNVYVGIVNNAGQLAGLFRSGDGGGAWTALDVPTTVESGVAFGIHPGGQGGTNLSIAADRTNANVVYIGGDRQPCATQNLGCPTPPPAWWPNSIGANDFSGRLFRIDASQPAGAQAAHITHSNTGASSAPHADSRGMAIDANGDLIEVDDGGIYKRTTPLTNTGDWFSLNGDIQTTEFHDLAWDSNAKVLIGGAQDTGTPEELLPGNPRWQSVSTADGGDVAVDDFGTPGTSVRYSSSQGLGGFRRRTYDAANTFISQVFPALTVVGGGAPLTRQFTTPVAVNGVTPTRLIIGGGNSVYESLDQGNTITEIGVGIPVNAGGRDPIAYGATGNADMLYVGSGDDVWVRTAAAPAALTMSAAYPGAGTGRLVAGIAIDPADPQTAYVTDATNVYRTTDAGANWVNITGDLMTLTPGTLLSIAYSTSNADGSVIVGGNNGVFIARGPGFTVWTPVAADLPRAPVYDLDYDAVDEILVAGLMGRGGWTVSLDERDPVDVALVLDLSGSMLSPACPTCDPKLQVLKDAVELFVQLWTVVTVPDDRLGLNYFRTTISEFLPGGNPLFDVLPNAAALIADVQSQTTVGSNLTAMGGGLQTAINRLTDATRPRNIILFTDGMQNVNPMVNTTTFEIADEPGRPSSGVSPTTPVTDLNTALGIKVNTIGVGATPAFVDLLDDIAAETNGLFKLTTAPDADLRQFYVEELVDVLRQFSPQLLGYRRGAARADSVIESFTTNGSARRVIFALSWRRGAQLGLSVEKDGVDVTRDGRMISGPFYRIFTLDVPTTAHGRPIAPGGAWRLRIQGTAGIPYEVAAIVDEADLTYAFSVGGKDHVAGDPLPLTVRVALAGRPVMDARVTARVLAPRQALGTLLATSATPAEPAGFQYEPAATAAQRKLQLLLGQDAFRAALVPVPTDVTLQHTGGGNYSATFSNTAVTGSYTVVFRIEGRRPDIGSYDRTESRSVTVRFGRAVLKASALRVVPVERAAADRRYELQVRPADGAGNYLGPDYGHRITVAVDGTPVRTAPRDLLDGSYAFPLVLPVSGVADVTVTVMGQPLYSGPLSQIPGTGGGPTGLVLSGHLGTAVPGTGFAAAATAGLLAELDLEYRITPSFSIEGVVGRYDFGSGGDITGGTLYLKGYVGAGAWRFYGAAGPGVFKPQGADADVGASVAAGLNRPLGGPVELDAGAGYSYVFRTGGLGFLTFRAGVKVAM